MARPQLPLAVQRAGISAYGSLPRSVRYRLARSLSPRYTVGVLVLVTRPDGRVLLVKQRYRPEWFLPGGLVRRREPVVLAAYRELREEASIVFAPDMVMGESTTDAERRWVTCHAFVTVDDDVADAARATGPEIEAIWWCAPDGVPQDAASVRRALRLAPGRHG